MYPSSPPLPWLNNWNAWHRPKALQLCSNSCPFHQQFTLLLQHNPPWPEHTPVITSLLDRFATHFSEPHSLPLTHSITHHIHLLPNSNPVNVKPYCYPYFQKAELEKQVATMLDSDMIQPSHSPFSSPVLLVKKKDRSWRCCMDYRALNAITIKYCFPMSMIDELLDELGPASWFSKLDLRKGFHQIRMVEEDIHKMMFRTHHDYYEFKVMPFGLWNTLSTFQATMNDILWPFLWMFVIVFFDNILVYSPSLPLDVEHLEAVLSSLVQGQFLLWHSKCVFTKNQLHYLGHIVFVSGIAPDPSKIQAMLDWLVPSSPSELRGFLHLTGFYQKLIRAYAAIISPLTTFLRKDQFSWQLALQQAFDQLKHLMTQAPVIATPNFSLPFTVEIGTSGTTLGVVLLQNSHPIAYYSKVFCPHLQKASTYVHELHAITSTVHKWHHYLLGHPLVILTALLKKYSLATETTQSLSVTEIATREIWPKL